MTLLPQRLTLITLIIEAHKSGARIFKACHVIGFSLRTYQRWRKDAFATSPPSQEIRATNININIASVSDAVNHAPAPAVAVAVAVEAAAAAAAAAAAKITIETALQPTSKAAAETALETAPPTPQGDRRESGKRSVCIPHNKLSEVEVNIIIDTVNSAEYKDLSPCQIVPRLADLFIYLASVSTIYRVMRRFNQMVDRRNERKGQKGKKPKALMATAPNQVYSWDITYLPTAIRGQYFYLYLYVDIFSRKIVGWQVFAEENGDNAAQLLEDIYRHEGITSHQLTLHSDNGSPMKGETMLAMMQRLNVTASRSRPSVSNDNPYSESLFHTIKHRPALPLHPFAEIAHARRWVTEMVAWYNNDHRHSAIRFVTPSERHAGLDRAILAKRKALFEQARLKNPQRWSKNTRNWDYIDCVHLNPETKPKKELNNSKNLPK